MKKQRFKILLFVLPCILLIPFIYSIFMLDFKSSVPFLILLIMAIIAVVIQLLINMEGVVLLLFISIKNGVILFAEFFMAFLFAFSKSNCNIIAMIIFEVMLVVISLSIITLFILECLAARKKGII